jgi:hypothetical protein
MPVTSWGLGLKDAFGRNLFPGDFGYEILAERQGIPTTLGAQMAQQSAQSTPSLTAPSISMSGGAVGMGGAGGVGGAAGGGGAGGGGDASATFAAAAAAADPFASQRGQYQNSLAQLMQGNFTPSDPSYKFRVDQGQQALERSAAAKGFLGSGNILQELQKYGQDMGSQEYQNQYNRLLPLTGATTGSSGAAGSILAQQPGFGLDAYRTGMEAVKLPYQLQAMQQQGASGNVELQMMQNQLAEMQRAQQKARMSGPVMPVYQQGFLGG